MEKREELLRRVALKCADFARQLAYHRAFKECIDEYKLNFWIYMSNNTIDLSILDWSHLFGKYDDHLHWKKVIITEKTLFKTELLEFLNFTEDEWKDYHRSIKDFRDKDIAHIEIRPISNVPDMSKAFEATNYYYQHIYKELSSYSCYCTWPKDLSDYFQDIYNQTVIVLSAAYDATKSIDEKYY